MIQEDFSSMRAAMIASQLRTNAVSSPLIVAALGAVKREAFVPSDRASMAYTDIPVPLSLGRSLNAPLVTARLINEANIKAGDKVLLIGAATGYAAALLAELGTHVVALEEDASMYANASEQLGTFASVSLVHGALNKGWPSQAAYDAIIIDGAVEDIPQMIWDQLREGGVLAAAVIESGVTRLAVGRCAGAGGSLISFVDMEAVHLPGFEKPRGFRF